MYLSLPVARQWGINKVIFFRGQRNLCSPLELTRNSSGGYPQRKFRQDVGVSDFYAD